MADQRDKVWFWVEMMKAMKKQKIIWPQDHIDGDDIWVVSVDGTMSASNKRKHPALSKDPELFDFKHCSVEWNTEVGVSIKESCCIWINGPYRAHLKGTLLGLVLRYHHFHKITDTYAINRCHLV